jgi:excisionase family DNA binding protein
MRPRAGSRKGKTVTVDLNELLTPKAAAAHLGLVSSTMIALDQRGRVKAIRVGGRRMFLRRDVDEYARQRAKRRHVLTALRQARKEGAR